MGTISKRKTKDGKSFRYTATVRIQRQDTPNFTKSKTFSKESLAKEWIKKIEAQIEINPDILKKSTQSVYGNTLAQMIEHYSVQTQGQYNEKHETNLKRIARYDICKANVFTLTRHDFSSFAMWRRRGDVENMQNAVSPSTVLKDLSEISTVINHAIFVWGMDLNHVKSEFDFAMRGLKKSRIVGKSKQLDRLPTGEELQLLTNFFYREWAVGRGSIPMHLIMWLAIYTGRRQDELCHLLLSDFDRANNQWLVRDVKNPNGTIGNHKYAHLEPNALLLIDECLDVTTRNRMSILGYDQNLLIPMNAQTISSYFARGCKICEIDGLRFHDLRHECATRYAEDGFSIPQLQTITLHSSWASLQRYVNLKKRSDRLDYVDAIANAKKLHSEHNITTKTVKRHINRVDIAHAKKAIEIAKNPTMLQANWDFIQPFLDSFVKDFHPSKRIVDDFTLHLGVDNVFLWDNARQRFTLDYTQDAWEKYLFKHFTIDDLPDGATHFDCRTLDVLRIDDYHVYKYVQGVWADITAYYTLHKERLIELF